METKEQVKHTPYRILNSKEVWAERQMVAKAFTVDVAESIVHEHNCYGELLEACKAAFRALPGSADAIAIQCQFAIAKAEGR